LPWIELLHNRAEERRESSAPPPPDDDAPRRQLLKLTPSPQLDRPHDDNSGAEDDGRS